nr:PREDICTED: uncharacterized protein LOC104951735 [Notothenia coriiceps]
MALKIMNTAHTVGPRSTAFPVEDLVRMLMFRTTEEGTDFIQQYGLNVNEGMVELSRIAFQEPELPLSQKKSAVILAKRSVLIGEVVNGGPLPNPPQHTPACSFDPQNKYRGEGPLAEPTQSLFKGMPSFLLIETLTNIAMEADLQDLMEMIAQLKADNEHLRRERAASRGSTSADGGPSTAPQPSTSRGVHTSERVLYLPRERKCPVFRDQAYFIYDHLESEAREEIRYQPQESFFSRKQLVGESLQEYSHALFCLMEKMVKSTPGVDEQLDHLGSCVEQAAARGLESEAEQVCILSKKESYDPFLGFASYYRRFVEGFAKLAAPLHRLVAEAQRTHRRKQQQPLEDSWTEESGQEFPRNLRAKLEVIRAAPIRDIHSHGLAENLAASEAHTLYWGKRHKTPETRPAQSNPLSTGPGAVSDNEKESTRMEWNCW